MKTKNIIILLSLIIFTFIIITNVNAYKNICLNDGETLYYNSTDLFYTCHLETGQGYCMLCVTDEFNVANPTQCSALECEYLNQSNNNQNVVNITNETTNSENPNQQSSNGGGGGSSSNHNSGSNTLTITIQNKTNQSQSVVNTEGTPIYNLQDNTTKINNTNETNTQTTQPKNNTTTYLIVAIVILISILIAYLLTRKKKQSGRHSKLYIVTV